MSLLAHGVRKYPDAELRTSSAGLNWAGIATELRRHESSEVTPGPSGHMELAVIVRRDAGAFVSRKGAGERQDLRIEPKRVWLCPLGVDVEFIRFQGSMDILHFYLDPLKFDDLSTSAGGLPVSARAIRYLAGLEDDLILQIAATFLSEMRHQTAGGKVLMETLALALTARLVQLYAETGPSKEDRLRSPHGLDPKRLQRVLEYMTAHLEDDLTIERLASIACVSPFHFIRMFKRSVGVPPHRYVSGLRLARAKEMLACHALPIADIAARIRFSSQPNFSRAFRHATGLSPAAYRRAAALGAG